MKQFAVFFLAVASLLAFAPSSAFATPTTLTVVEMSDSGTAVASNAADTSNGNRFKNQGGNVFLLLQNTDGSNSATVTITSQHTSVYYPGLGTVSRADISVSLAAGDIKIVGPLPTKIFNDSSQYVNMTITGTGAASVNISPFTGKSLAKGTY